ncbi:hypothetical protein HDU92_008459 [Lobulomyces angularis]|nr:hypothetical protein HDU92_008459 [Lobulomyces angularis]
MNREELEKELDVVTKKLKSRDERTGINYLVTKGLPKLGRNLISESKPSYEKSFAERDSKLEIIESEFNILKNYSYNNLLKSENPSTMWINAMKKGGNLGTWNSESVIQKFVSNALDDINSYFEEDIKIDILHEQDISSTIKNFISDITVFRAIDNNIIGVCEVKKPSKGGNDLNNYYLYCQIDCYMQELRYTYGIKYVYGIISTYNEWKICWYSNSQTISALDDTNKISEYISNDIDSYPYIIDNDKLYVSKVYKYNDQLITQILISCMCKMYMTHIETPKIIGNKNFKFRYIESGQDRIYWKFISFTKPFTYEMPNSKTKNFYLLKKYHGGRDGRVWLALSNNANLAVIKAPRKEKEHISKKIFTQESSYWNELWNCNSYTIEILDITMIVMPYAFHCIQDDNDRVYFKSPDIWNDIGRKEEDNVFNCEDILESKNKLFDTEDLEKYFKNPLLVAREALTVMKEKGYIHDDIQWRHVSLLPFKKSENIWGLKPIMIDLTRIKKIPNGEIINIEDELKKLNNEQ